jgi:hypothetical protein
MQNDKGETQRPEVSMGDKKTENFVWQEHARQDAKHGPKNFIE